MPGLSQIRRLEAAAFRAWPAASTYYDGTWSIRLTPEHPSRRLNSINPLDPNDHSELDGRIERASARFAAVGRELTFRQTPLASRELDRYFQDKAYPATNESMVLGVDLSQIKFGRAVDHIPLRDVGRYVDASLVVHGQDRSRKAGLLSVIGNIKAVTGLFVSEDAQGPLASVMCVQDGDLAGILDLGTRADARRQGHGKALLVAALKWARARGAANAWLQMEMKNVEAISLYKDLGFEEAYRYVYRTKPNLTGQILK